jgi:hypothetical protein
LKSSAAKSRSRTSSCEAAANSFDCRAPQIPGFSRIQGLPRKLPLGLLQSLLQ